MSHPQSLIQAGRLPDCLIAQDSLRSELLIFNPPLYLIDPSLRHRLGWAVRMKFTLKAWLFGVVHKLRCIRVRPASCHVAQRSGGSGILS
jgi:hypothetical protein